MITLLTVSVFSHRNSENISKSSSSSHTRVLVVARAREKEKPVRRLLFLILQHKETKNQSESVKAVRSRSGIAV